MLDKISDKIKAYEKAIEESAARHNGMVGALNELRQLLEVAKQEHEVVEEVIYTSEE